MARTFEWPEHYEGPPRPEDADEMRELKSEVARHHRDFSAIRELVHDALDHHVDDNLHLTMTLAAIRGIVG